MKIEKRIVDAKRGIVQITTSDTRWYQIREPKKGEFLTQDDFYPSITWIGSYYPKTIRYMRWLADKGWDKAEEVKNLAAEKGSREHNACADLVKGVKIKIDSQYSDSEGEVKELTGEEYAGIMSFKEWLDEEQPQILGLDYTILNHKYRYAGTVDIKCRIKSDNYQSVWIIDLKTSQDIWPSHEIQVSAYKAADPEVQKIAILQIGYNRNKTKKYKFTEISDQFNLFLSTKNIWAKEQSDFVIPQKDYPTELTWKRERTYPTGENHPNWKGDLVKYNKLHEWIQKNWVKPDICENCNEKSKLDWANVSGEYKRSDRKDWKALCRKYHVKMDWTLEKSASRSATMKNYANSLKGKLEMKRRGAIANENRAILKKSLVKKAKRAVKSKTT